MERKKFMWIGLGMALIISVLAPFIASSNPDGLEGAAEKFEGTEEKAFLFFNSPFPDYIIPSIGNGNLSGMGAMVLGTVLIFVLTYGLSKAFTRG